jgi:hypothetical protein
VSNPSHNPTNSICLLLCLHFFKVKVINLASRFCSFLSIQICLAFQWPHQVRSPGSWPVWIFEVALYCRFYCCSGPGYDAAYDLPVPSRSVVTMSRPQKLLRKPPVFQTNNVNPLSSFKSSKLRLSNAPVCPHEKLLYRFPTNSSRNSHICACRLE